jgi:Protein of unknown function (DUF3891)
VLVRLADDGAIVIGQLSHAWLSGQLARAWGNDDFPAPDPREEIALGAEQHDIGWARADLHPAFNPETGLPRNFLELTVEEHLAIWRDAPQHLMSQSLHAALVVSMHGSSLSELRARNDPAQAPLLEAHVEEEHARQRWLSELLGVAPQQAERVRRQMWTWDGLSLALCNAWRPFVARDVPSAEGLIELELLDRADGTVGIDPWPFAASELTVRCQARELASRYQDERRLREHLIRAKPVTLEFVLRRPG